MRKIFLLSFILLLLAVSPAACAEVITVSPGGLSDALNAAADGDVLILSDGVYAEPAETFPLRISSEITLRAAEGASPVIDAPPFLSALRVEAEHVSLQGLDIQFRRHGLYVTGSHIRITDCSFRLADEQWRTSSCGIWLGGVTNAVLQGCDFTGCGICLAGPPLSESSKSVPVLTGMFEVGESRDYFTTHTIEDCTVNGKPLFYAVSQPYVCAPENAGEIIIADCDEVLVRNADVSQASMGMEIIYCGHVRVENSTASDCGIFGIYFAKLQSGEMVECYTQGTNHGLDIRDCKNVTLLRCTAERCDQGLFFSCVTDGVMQDCVVSDTGQGIFLAAGSGSRIEGCQVIGCENGMNIQKELNAQIADCTIQECTVCGVRLDDSPATLTGCQLENNWVSVMAYGGVPFAITDNTIHGSQSCGLYLRDIGSSRIFGNLFTESRSYSLQAFGTLSNTALDDNCFDLPADLSHAEIMPGAAAEGFTQ